MTRRFQIYLAPPGAGPEYHHSGLENGFAPPHTLTNYAALAGLPSSCSRWWARLSSTHPLVAAENYAALTRDNDE